MMQETECVIVEWPATEAEKLVALVDPDAARVVRPVTEPPLAPDPDVAAGITAPGVDLSAYHWRGPEAGVRLGGTDGRWYISVSESAAREGESVRPAPLVLDSCEFPTINDALKATDMWALIRTSGSLLNGRLAATRNLHLSMSRAVGRNPHWSPMCNGAMPVGDALVTVGCTVPEIRVGMDTYRAEWERQRPDVWQAGVSELQWIFRNDGGFVPEEFWAQVDWTLTPNAEPAQGGWTDWPWAYRFPESGSLKPDGTASNTYRAYREQIRRVEVAYQQPGIATTIGVDTGNPIAALPGRLRGFILYTNLLRNRINADSNIIRGLHGFAQVRKVCIDRFNSSVSLPGVTVSEDPYAALGLDGVPIDIRPFCGREAAASLSVFPTIGTGGSGTIGGTGGSGVVGGGVPRVG